MPESQVNQQMADALDLERELTRKERDEMVRSDQDQADAIARALERTRTESS